MEPAIDIEKEKQQRKHHIPIIQQQNVVDCATDLCQLLKNLEGTNLDLVIILKMARIMSNKIRVERSRESVRMIIGLEERNSYILSIEYDVYYCNDKIY